MTSWSRNPTRPMRRSRRGRLAAGGGQAGPRPRRLRSRRSTGSAGSLAICNPLYGVQLLFSEDMAARLLPRGQRLDGQGMARPRSAAARLDRGADAEHRIGGRRDRALRRGPPLRAGAGAGDGRDAARPAALLADLCGRRAHGLPIGIHAGSAYRHPLTSVGWPSYYVEDYAPGAGFQIAAASLISEGVFAKYPGSRWC